MDSSRFDSSASLMNPPARMLLDGGTPYGELKIPDYCEHDSRAPFGTISQF
jgi:hypothetical protein